MGHNTTSIGRPLYGDCVTTEVKKTLALSVLFLLVFIGASLADHAVTICCQIFTVASSPSICTATVNVTFRHCDAVTGGDLLRFESKPIQANRFSKPIATSLEDANPHSIRDLKPKMRAEALTTYIRPQGIGPMTPQGPTGPMAPQGPTGPMTPQGPTGPITPQGPTGPITPQGPTGPMTPQGPTSLFEQ